VENFSGEKPLLLGQDFYATLLVSNIASLVEQEAEAELKKKSEIKTESMRSTTSTKIS
jgi:hypothetical protein